jgi:hypothetical protein
MRVFGIIGTGEPRLSCDKWTRSRSPSRRASNMPELFPLAVKASSRPQVTIPSPRLSKSRTFCPRPLQVASRKEEPKQTREAQGLSRGPQGHRLEFSGTLTRQSSSWGTTRGEASKRPTVELPRAEVFVSQVSAEYRARSKNQIDKHSRGCSVALGPRAQGLW